MTEETVVKRDELKQVAVALLRYLGYDLKDPERPIRLKRSDTDADVQAKIMEACKVAMETDFNGQGAAGLPDEVACFMQETGVLAPLEEEGNAEEEEDLAEEAPLLEEDPPEEESLAAEALALEDDPAFAAAMRDADVGAAAEEATEEEGPQVEEEPPEVDAKVKELALEQGRTQSTLRDVPAPVTAQNIEVAVLAMCQMLARGQVVIVSTHDIDELPAGLHLHPLSVETEPEPSLAPVAPKPKPKGAPKPKDALEVALLKVREAVVHGELKPRKARLAFIAEHKIALKANQDPDAAGDRVLANAIITFRKGRLMKAAERRAAAAKMKAK